MGEGSRSKMIANQPTNSKRVSVRRGLLLIRLVALPAYLLVQPTETQALVLHCSESHALLVLAPICQSTEGGECE
jgi:hypothetical protein